MTRELISTSKSIEDSDADVVGAAIVDVLVTAPVDSSILFSDTTLE